MVTMGHCYRKVGQRLAAKESSVPAPTRCQSMGMREQELPGYKQLRNDVDGGTSAHSIDECQMRRSSARSSHKTHTNMGELRRLSPDLCAAGSVNWAS